MPDDKLSRLSRWIGPAAIIGVLVLATVRARKDARRQEVQGQLQQLRLALRQYESTFTAYLPDGNLNEDGTGFRGRPLAPLLPPLLPYLDSASLYNKFPLPPPESPWKTVGLWTDRNAMWAMEGRKNADGEVISVRFTPLVTSFQPVTFPADAALRGLAAHPKLLNFDGGNHFSDAALQSLANFRQLEEVALGGPRITDAGAGQLADFPALQALTLDQSTITKHGLNELKRAPKLSKLKMIEPAFGDEGLAVLEQFPALAEVELNWYFRPVKVTYAAMAKLLEAKPELKLQIRHDGSVLTNEAIRLLAAKRAP